MTRVSFVCRQIENGQLLKETERVAACLADETRERKRLQLVVSALTEKEKRSSLEKERCEKVAKVFKEEKSSMLVEIGQLKNSLANLKKKKSGAKEADQLKESLDREIRQSKVSAKKALSEQKKLESKVKALTEEKAANMVEMKEMRASLKSSRRKGGSNKAVKDNDIRSVEKIRRDDLKKAAEVTARQEELLQQNIVLMDEIKRLRESSTKSEMRYTEIFDGMKTQSLNLVNGFKGMTDELEDYRSKEAMTHKKEEEFVKAKAAFVVRVSKQQKELVKAKKDLQANASKQQEEFEKAKKDLEANALKQQKELEKTKKDLKANALKQQEELIKEKADLEANASKQQEEFEKAKGDFEVNTSKLGEVVVKSERRDFISSMKIKVAELEAKKTRKEKEIAVYSLMSCRERVKELENANAVLETAVLKQMEIVQEGLEREKNLAAEREAVEIEVAKRKREQEIAVCGLIEARARLAEGQKTEGVLATKVEAADERERDLVEAKAALEATVEKQTEVLAALEASSAAAQTATAAAVEKRERVLAKAEAAETEVKRLKVKCSDMKSSRHHETAHYASCLEQLRRTLDEEKREMSRRFHCEQAHLRVSVVFSSQT